MAATMSAASCACASIAAVSHSRVSGRQSVSTVSASGLAPLNVLKAKVNGKVLRSAVVKTARFSVSAKLEDATQDAQTSQLAQLFESAEVQTQAAQTMAGALFLLLANTGSAAAAQEVFQLADADSRGFLLLVVLAPAVGWVLFNILQPALRQFDNMKGAKGVVGALGLGALASMAMAPQADAAQEIAQLAVDADARPLILLVVLGPAVGWVLFNILQPALRQFNNMRGVKSVAGAVGLGATASLMAAPHADAAQEIAQLAADVDARPLILLVVLGPAIGWVLFNILQPALRQFNNMRGIKSVAGAVGLGAAASLLAAPEADAAQEVYQLAVDSRPLILLVVLVPAVGWVLFNILGPALRQLQNMIGSGSNKPTKRR